MWSSRRWQMTHCSVTKSPVCKFDLGPVWLKVNNPREFVWWLHHVNKTGLTTWGALCHSQHTDQSFRHSVKVSDPFSLSPSSQTEAFPYPRRMRESIDSISCPMIMNSLYTGQSASHPNILQVTLDQYVFRQERSAHAQRMGARTEIQPEHLYYFP